MLGAERSLAGRPTLDTHLPVVATARRGAPMSDPIKRQFVAKTKDGRTVTIIERTRQVAVPAFGTPHYMDKPYFETEDGKPVTMIAFGGPFQVAGSADTYSEVTG